MSTYRAATFRDICMTSEDQAALSDAELLAEAEREAERADIIDDEASDDEAAYPRVTRQTFRADLRVDDWTDPYAEELAIYRRVE